MLNRTIPICIEPGGVPEIIYISQYDVGLQTFVFVPYTNNGTLTVPSGASATLEGTKPDGYAFVHNCTYNTSNGQITYTVQDQLAAVAGRVWSKLVIRDTSGNILGFRAIVWIVDFAGVKDGAVVSDSDISALEEFVNEFGTINAYKAALDGAMAAVGGPYVASTVAQMTDRTKVYVYTGSETGYTAGHWYYWNGSAWTDGGVYQAAAVETDKTLAVADMAADAKVTGDKISELKNELKLATGVEKINLTDKQYVNLSYTTVTMSDGRPEMQSTNNFNCAVLPCVEGDVFTISGVGGSSARLWGFVDESGNVISKADSNAEESEKELSAPVGSAWLIVNNSVSSNAVSHVGGDLSKRIGELETHIDNALFVERNISNFESGTINVNGVLDVSNKRVRSKDFINVNDFVSIILTTDNLKVSLRYYDETQTYISGDNYFTVESIYDLTTHLRYPENVSFIKIVAAYNDNSTIADVSAFNSLVETNVDESKLDILSDKDVDITDSLNEEGYINLGYKHGNVNNSTGIDEWNNLARAFSHVYVPVDEIVRIVANNQAQYSLRYYDENKQYLSGMNSWASSETFSVPNGCKYIRICGRYSSNAEITNLLQFAEDLKVYCKSFRLDDIEKRFPFASNNKMFAKSVGNVSIVCAKELTNDDGNCPAIEWYLLEEAGGTNRFYVSHDLHGKQFAFMFTGDAYMYSFGVLANGDIIAVLDASSINWDDAGDVPRSETFRKNPYVFLASENWTVQHEVAFTGDLKPLGWLSNYGFRVLPDGSAVFAEYTRYCVLTSNVWRVNGDPTDATNWTAVISLNLPEPGLDLLKHWHTVQYDPYGKVVYAATGDSNTGSFCYYSTDYGVTWTQLSVNGVDHSDKYFRFLNLIFTEDTIYWAKDWYDEGHYLFKCGRNANGILDIDNVVDWIQIPTVENLSTYTTCYIPEIDAILLLEREDSGGGTNAPAPIRLCDLTDGTLHTVAYMKSAKGVREQIGFRTRYSEVYPVHGIINVGWALRRQINANAVNLLAWYDNAGNDDTPRRYGLDNVNNLWLEVYKNSSGFKLRVGTRLI